MDGPLVLLGLAAGLFLLAFVVKEVGRTHRGDLADLRAVVYYTVICGMGFGSVLSSMVLTALSK